MWSDNETTEDLIGFQVHADLIRELIVDPSVLPATIGIFGDWGGGKSSIMQMLRDDLEARAEKNGKDSADYKGVAVLYFNGWLFEGYDDAKAALLSSILTSLRDHKRFGPKIKGKVTSLLKRVDYMRGIRILLSGAAVGGISALTGGAGLAMLLPVIASGTLAGLKDSAPEALKEALVKASESTPDEMLSDIRQFRDDFGRLLTESDISTLVVLIDDLDRCSPERIIENLEAIKLFLNVPRTAFVIGADRRVIRQAVSWRYKDALKADVFDDRAGKDNPRRLVDDYVEKLIQIPYTLPRLSPSEIETYLTLLFCKRHLKPDVFDSVLAIAREQRSKNHYCVFGQTKVLEKLSGTTVPPKLSEALRIVSSAAAQITDVLQGNPRQVKRFLNAFYLRRKLADVATLEEFRDEILVKLMLLEYAASHLFERLFELMDGSTGIVEILARLETKKDEDPKIKSLSPDDDLAEWKSMGKWLAMEPPLANEDLRDYMWVTRDRLGSTLSGTTMLPPVVKAILRQCLSKMGDSEARKSICQLTVQERQLLSNELIIHAQKHPSEVKAFQALMEICKNDAPLVEEFGNLIRRIPKDELPAALGVYIATQAKDAGDLAGACQGIITSFKGGDSTFEKALNKKGR